MYLNKVLFPAPDCSYNSKQLEGELIWISHKIHPHIISLPSSQFNSFSNGKKFGKSDGNDDNQPKHKKITFSNFFSRIIHKKREDANNKFGNSNDSPCSIDLSKQITINKEILGITHGNSNDYLSSSSATFDVVFKENIKVNELDTVFDKELRNSCIENVPHEERRYDHLSEGELKKKIEKTRIDSYTLPINIGICQEFEENKIEEIEEYKNDIDMEKKKKKKNSCFGFLHNNNIKKKLENSEYSKKTNHFSLALALPKSNDISISNSHELNNENNLHNYNRNSYKTSNNEDNIDIDVINSKTKSPKETNIIEYLALNSPRIEDINKISTFSSNKSEYDAMSDKYSQINPKIDKLRIMALSESDEDITDLKNEKLFPCLLLQSKFPTSKILVYFHGNGEDIYLAYDLLGHLRNYLQVIFFKFISFIIVGSCICCRISRIWSLSRRFFKRKKDIE